MSDDEQGSPVKRRLLVLRLVGYTAAATAAVASVATPTSSARAADRDPNDDSDPRDPRIRRRAPPRRRARHSDGYDRDRSDRADND